MVARNTMLTGRCDFLIERQQCYKRESKRASFTLYLYQSRILPVPKYLAPLSDDKAESTSHQKDSSRHELFSKYPII